MDHLSPKPRHPRTAPGWLQWVLFLGGVFILYDANYSQAGLRGSDALRWTLSTMAALLVLSFTLIFADRPRHRIYRILILALGILLMTVGFVWYLSTLPPGLHG